MLTYLFEPHEPLRAAFIGFIDFPLFSKEVLRGKGTKKQKNKSTLHNSPPPLLNLKLLLRPKGQIIDV